MLRLLRIYVEVINTDVRFKFMRQWLIFNSFLKIFSKVL